jgi:acetyl-CoA carboxylase carboxyl transferase subunit beta
MTWPDKKPGGLDASEKPTLGKGVFRKCDGCGETLPADAFEKNFEVCPQCGRHHKLVAARWRQLLLDDGQLEEWDSHLEPTDPLGFTDGKPYPERVAASQKATRAKEAIETGRAKLEGIPIAYGAFLFHFMGGSMGSVVGEKFTRAAEHAHDERAPLVCFAATGGARMQEGLFSLMQMAKTSAALARMRSAGVPYVSVLTHPTTGGVSASLGMLGDINIGEPKALIGFAGPRVIEQTVRETLPEGFQRSEFLIDHGAIDLIVDRRQMRDKISAMLAVLTKKPKAA